MRPIFDFIKAMWIMIKWGIPVLLATGFFSAIVGLLLVGAKALLELVAPSMVGPFEAWMMIIGVLSLVMFFVFFAIIAAHRAFRDMDKASQGNNSEEHFEALVAE